jgi:two-component system LytT family sensor kinase
MAVSTLAVPRAWFSASSLRLRVALHLLMWAGFISFQYFLYQLQPTLPAVMAAFMVKDLAASVISFYFFSHVMLPRFIVRRRWLLSALGLVGIYYLWALLSHLTYAALDYYHIPMGEWADYMHRSLDKGLWEGVFSWYGVSMGLSDFFIIPMQPILLRFIVFLLTASNQSLRLQRENLTLEVSFLKAQVNPHFLFNTLNNIYTMVVKQDERAPAMVRHLTGLMHYTVYESDAARVPLSREIGFLEDYLELERLRYGRKVSIEYHKSGPLEQFCITPLLFFPFVENAFKHGVDSSLDASWVNIVLAVKDGQLHFEVRNSLTPSGARREFGGVGVANVQKRLALHYPPGDYQFSIGPEPEQQAYRVALVLKLDPHPA